MDDLRDFLEVLILVISFQLRSPVSGWTGGDDKGVMSDELGGKRGGALS